MNLRFLTTTQTGCVVSVELCTQIKSTMNILNFMNEFSTIEECEEQFRSHREHEGIVCKKCKSEHYYWLKGKKQWNVSAVNSEQHYVVEL